MASEIVFYTKGKSNRFELEIFSYHEKKDTHKRWQMVVHGDRHKIFSRIMLWSLPGEPLAKSQPLEKFPSGLMISSPSKSPFAQALQRSKFVLVVPNSKRSIYTRVWCAYEVFLAYLWNKHIFTASAPTPKGTYTPPAEGLGPPAP